MMRSHGASPRANRAWSVLLFAAAAADCGLSHTIERDLLRDITIEQKLRLFDAQNEVSITLDEREQLRRGITDLRQDTNEVQRRIRDAQDDRERAKGKRDEPAIRLADLTETVLALKLEFLSARIEYQRQRMDVQDELVTVARAKFELAKATLVKRNNLRGAADIDLADFEEQVDKSVEAARSEQADLATAGKRVDAANKTWLAKRQELQQASGGALGNPWVDDTESWEW